MACVFYFIARAEGLSESSWAGSVDTVVDSPGWARCAQARRGVRSSLVRVLPICLAALAGHGARKGRRSWDAHLGAFLIGVSISTFERSSAPCTWECMHIHSGAVAPA